MNILGIGTDIVSKARIQRLWEHYGESFAKRILTGEEIDELNSSATPVSFLAKRYAAKEALAKAYGTGFRPQGLLLNEIGVKNDSLGQPHLYFVGKTAELIKTRVLTSFLSLSDEQEFALSFVVLVGMEGAN